LGLGLSLARRLVELHGGSLDVTSAGLGQGSRFVMRMPRATADARVGISPAGVSDVAAVPRSHRVLIVDDNRDFAESLSTMLATLGHEVRIAHDGEQGLTAATQFVPEIAFLDIGMPRMNGYDLATRIRATPAIRGTYLVAVTGWGQESDKQRAQAAGFNVHLIKPAELDRVVAIIDSFAA